MIYTILQIINTFIYIFKIITKKISFATKEAFSFGKSLKCSRTIRSSMHEINEPAAKYKLGNQQSTLKCIFSKRASANKLSRKNKCHQMMSKIIKLQLTRFVFLDNLLVKNPLIFSIMQTREYLRNNQGTHQVY